MRVSRNSIFSPGGQGTPRPAHPSKDPPGGSRINPRMTHDKRIKASARDRDRRVMRGVRAVCPARGAWCVRRVARGVSGAPVVELPFEIRELKYIVMRYAIVQ